MQAAAYVMLFAANAVPWFLGLGFYIGMWLCITRAYIYKRSLYVYIFIYTHVYIYIYILHEVPDLRVYRDCVERGSICIYIYIYKGYIYMDFFVFVYWHSGC